MPRRTIAFAGRAPIASLANVTASAGDGSRPLLSPRETEVLRLLALGHTNREIAATLELSVRTVENHVYQILDILQVANRTEAARLAMPHLIARG